MSAQHNNEQAAPRPLQMGAKGAYIVRLLMVGDSSCGKTSLVLRFDQNVFSTKFVTTIGVDYRDKMVKVCFCLPKMCIKSCVFFVNTAFTYNDIVPYSTLFPNTSFRSKGRQ